MENFIVVNHTEVISSAISNSSSKKNANPTKAKEKVSALTSFKLALVFLIGLFGASAAFATTWTVPGDYATIQLALADTANVVSDDVILLGGLTLTESGQLVIDRNLTIEGTNQSDTIIRTDQDTGASGDSRGWILVNDGITLNLSNLTLDGTGFDVHQAIRSRGNGTIQNVTFTNIQFEPSGPSYAGTAIAAFGAGVQNINVIDSTFSQIGRIGALYFGTGITDSTFRGNTYIGKGSGDWLDYALDISAGANVLVEGNTISNIYGVASSDSAISSAILVSTFFAPGTIATINDNTISNNSHGVFVGFDGSDTSTVVARNNAIFDNAVLGLTTTNATVDATRNWWGSRSGPADATSGDGSTPDTNAGSGDVVSGATNYSNWLREFPGTGSCFYVSKLQNGKVVTFPLGCD